MISVVRTGQMTERSNGPLPLPIYKYAPVAGNLLQADLGNVGGRGR